VLSEVEPLVVPAGATVRTFEFQRGVVGYHKGWTINGKSFDPDHPIADIPLGQVERWRFHTDVHHPIHVHLDQFQVLSRDGKPPAATDGGWKDTVDLPPFEVVDVAVRFSDYAGRYVMHCHNLEHEDMAMMAAISTV
jgi:spore coat protein A